MGGINQKGLEDNMQGDTDDQLTKRFSSKKKNIWKRELGIMKTLFFGLADRRPDSTSYLNIADTIASSTFRLGFHLNSCS